MKGGEDTFPASSFHGFPPFSFILSFPATKIHTYTHAKRNKAPFAFSPLFIFEARPRRQPASIPHFWHGNSLPPFPRWRPDEGKCNRCNSPKRKGYYKAAFPSSVVCMLLLPLTCSKGSLALLLLPRSVTHATAAAAVVGTRPPLSSEKRARGEEKALPSCSPHV